MEQIGPGCAFSAGTKPVQDDIRIALLQKRKQQDRISPWCKRTTVFPHTTTNFLAAIYELRARLSDDHQIFANVELKVTQRDDKISYVVFYTVIVKYTSCID